jgi:hypothetical protein
MSSDPKQQSLAEERARAWPELRRKTAVVLMGWGILSGLVGPLFWVMDQVSGSQRPTNPVAAFTLGPALIAVGFLLLDRRPKPPTP